MNKMIKIGLLFSILIYVSCQEPGDNPTNFELEEMESTLDITVSEGMDTLYVWGRVNLLYNTQPSNQTIDSIEIFLDDQRIHRIIDPLFFRLPEFGVTYGLKSEEFIDGWYKLRYLTHSYSAPDSTSRLYRYFTDTTTINLNIDNAPPDQIKVIESQIVDGKLEISWPKYTRGNFQYYKVVKNRDDFNSIKIVDKNINTWRDPNFVGGDATYRIDIEAADKLVEGLNNDFLYSLPVVSTNAENLDGIQVSWTRCLFDSAFIKYSLMRRLGSRGNWEKVFESEQISDSSFYDPLFLFGDKIYYRMDVASIGKETIGNSDFSFFGNSVTSFEELKYSSDQNLIYLLNPNSMNPTTHLINASTMETENIIYQTVPILSNNCSKAYYIAGQNKLLGVDPKTFESIEEFDLPQHTGRELAQINQVLASNNGRILFRGFTYSEPTFYFDRYYLFDLASMEVLATMGDYTPAEIVSHDLNHFVKEGGLYKYTELYGISGTGVAIEEAQYCFYPGEEAFITTHQNSIEIIELNNYTTIRNMDIDNPLYNLVFDETYEYLGGNEARYGGSIFRIYDLNTGNLILELDVIASRYWLANGNIFSSAGYYIPINEIK